MKIYETVIQDEEGTIGQSLFFKKQDAIRSIEKYADEMNKENHDLYLDDLDRAESWRYYRREIDGEVQYQNIEDILAVREREVL